MTRFLNSYEVDDRAQHFADHPILGPATRTLVALRDAADANSDGWAYWPKPIRAAARLMDLIDGDGTWEYRYGERDEVTAEQLAAAYRPLKALRTRTGLDFEIFGPVTDEPSAPGPASNIACQSEPECPPVDDRASNIASAPGPDDPSPLTCILLSDHGDDGDCTTHDHEPARPTGTPVDRVSLNNDDDFSRSTRALLFGELVRRAQPVIGHYQSDLYHDAMWIEGELESATSGTTFCWAVRLTGTDIGPGDDGAVDLFRRRAVDNELSYMVRLVWDRRWYAEFTPFVSPAATNVAMVVTAAST